MRTKITDELIKKCQELSGQMLFDKNFNCEKCGAEEDECIEMLQDALSEDE